jgi:hypothetical protein
VQPLLSLLAGEDAVRQVLVEERFMALVDQPAVHFAAKAASVLE